MPYIDDPKTGKTAAERKKEALEKWRKKSIESGYGKWLYARRKLRFEDAERFRKALEYIVDRSPEDRYGDSAALQMQQTAKDALFESDQAEAALGRFSKI